MQSDRIRLSVAEAREHAERGMRGIGYDAEEAYIVADHAIDAALCGYEYSGLAKLLNIPEHRRFKQPRLPIRVLRETEVSALYDGGNNVGMLAIYHAARAAIAKAATHGFAIVGVTNSWMSGRSAYYVEMIAKADLIGIHTAGSTRSVAPPGGTRPALGTNPIAFGLPSSRGPIVFDMGTSAFMGPIASGWGSCCRKGWQSTPKADRHAIPPWQGVVPCYRSAAIRALGWPLSCKRSGCSPPRRSTRIRTTGTYLWCSNPICSLTSTTSSGSLASLSSGSRPPRVNLR
jgi:hypothetical protein